MRMYMGEHPGMPGDGRYLFTVGGRRVVGNHNRGRWMRGTVGAGCETIDTYNLHIQEHLCSRRRRCCTFGAHRRINFPYRRAGIRHFGTCTLAVAHHSHRAVRWRATTSSCRGRTASCLTTCRSTARCSCSMHISTLYSRPVMFRE